MLRILDLSEATWTIHIVCLRHRKCAKNFFYAANDTVQYLEETDVLDSLSAFPDDVMTNNLDRSEMKYEHAGKNCLQTF